MKKIHLVLGCTLLVCGAMALASCVEHNDMLGSWKAISPMNITSDVAGSDNASFTPSITFEAGKDKSGGDVTVTGDLSIEKKLSPNAAGEILMAATGTSDVKGKWSYDIDDDDDLLLDFNLESLDVKFDKKDITFSGAGFDSLTDQQKDSLSVAATENCVRELRTALKSELARFSVIEDVEISKDKKTLGFEIKSPKTDLRFRNMDK